MLKDWLERQDTHPRGEREQHEETNPKHLWCSAVVGVNMWQAKYVGKTSEWSWDLRHTLKVGYNMDCKGKRCIVFEESCMAWGGMCGIQWQQNTSIGMYCRCQRLMENEVGCTRYSENKEVPKCSFEDSGYDSINSGHEDQPASIFFMWRL